MPVTICGSAALQHHAPQDLAIRSRRGSARRGSRLGSMPFTPVIVLMQDREEDAEEDDELVLRVADAEPEDRQRDPGERRASAAASRPAGRPGRSTAFHQPIAMPSGIDEAGPQEGDHLALQLSRRWRSSSPELISSQAARNIAVGRRQQRARGVVQHAHADVLPDHEDDGEQAQIPELAQHPARERWRPGRRCGTVAGGGAPGRQRAAKRRPSRSGGRRRDRAAHARATADGRAQGL